MTADQPNLTPEQATEIVQAIRTGGAIVCYSKCWGCQFGQCTPEPHTWMDDEDIVHAGLVVPTTEDGWAQLAKDRPCGCRCMDCHRESSVTSPSSSDGAP